MTAYAPFANGGIGVQPHVITRVRTADGRQLYLRKAANFGRVIDPQYVAMMNTMMTETLLTGTARKAELPGWQAAGKTGTSQEWRDAWFIGYTGALVCGVWLGNDDSSATKKVSGGNLPVEIWSRFMKEALAGVPVAAIPGGVWSSVDGSLPPAAQIGGEPLAEAPPAVAGAPMTLNKGGEAAAQQPTGKKQSPAPLVPLPPESIPGSGQAQPSKSDRAGIARLLGAT